MEAVYEFIQVIFECFSKFIATDIGMDNGGPKLPKVALLLGIIGLSCLLGWLTHKSSALWHKNIGNIPGYKPISIFSFFLTLLFFTSFFSLNSLREVSVNRTEQWKNNLQENKTWQEDTFRKAYYAVKEQGQENFSLYPAPEEGGRTIPVNQESSGRVIAKTYVNQAIEQFKQNHPYLSLILKADLEIPEQKIYDDNAAFFKNNPNQTYELKNAIKIAVDELKSSLERRIPPLIKTSRLFISIVYMSIMLAVFTVIGVLSYRDIKIFR